MKAYASRLGLRHPTPVGLAYASLRLYVWPTPAYACKSGLRQPTS